MNRITVIGRIVRDTELKQVGDGRIVMNNTVAIPRTFKTEFGQDTDFLNFVAWGKRAEIIEEYCNKGDLIGLDGRIQSRSYENEKKQTVYTIEMNVESVHFLQPRRGQNGKQDTVQRRQVEDKTESVSTTSSSDLNIEHIQTANSK